MRKKDERKVFTNDVEATQEIKVSTSAALQGDDAAVFENSPASMGDTETIVSISQEDISPDSPHGSQEVQETQNVPNLSRRRLEALEEEEGEQDLDSDLFRDNPPREPKKTRRAVAKNQAARKRRRKRRMIIIIVLIVILAACLGVLYYLYSSQNSKLGEIKEQEEKQLSDFTTIVDNATLPDGWSQETLDALKQQALNAYDHSFLEKIDQAEKGDKEAFDTVLSTDISSLNQNVSKYETIFSNLAAYPESLIKALINDPGKLDFVLAYPSHETSEVPATITLTENEIPDLKTFDTAWGYLPYGNDIFAVSGSAPTVISMVFATLMQDPEFTPVFIGDWATQYGYDVTPVSDNDSIFSGAAYTWGVNMTPLPAYPAYVNDSLEQNSIVVLELDENGKDHFVVVDGKNENGDWIILDPESSNGPTAVSADTLRDQMKGVWAFW